MNIFFCFFPHSFLFTGYKNTCEAVAFFEASITSSVDWHTGKCPLIRSDHLPLRHTQQYPTRNPDEYVYSKSGSSQIHGFQSLITLHFFFLILYNFVCSSIVVLWFVIEQCLNSATHFPCQLCPRELSVIPLLYHPAIPSSHMSLRPKKNNTPCHLIKIMAPLPRPGAQLLPESPPAGPPGSFPRPGPCRRAQPCHSGQSPCIHEPA